MRMMIVRHKVRDCGQWRPVFDQHAEMQKGAGLVSWLWGAGPKTQARLH
jgi:hypothetical protein